MNPIYLNANENPHATFDKKYVEALIKNYNFNRYPASSYENLRKKLANLNDLNFEEIIATNGSDELGPILGISDCILDIVETGNTLKENDLVVIEKFKDINSIIIANKIYYKTKFKEIDSFINKISNIMKED